MALDVGADENAREERITELLGQLSLAEKVAMLSGHGFFEQIAADGGRYCARPYHIGAGNERLGIPPLLFSDGPRGVAVGRSTCFPVPMARGASFDVDLERRIGDAIGRELRAHGANLFGGVCINLLRHPAWGRAQETYGEDPFLLGEMGAALVAGVQRHNAVATPKHFAANSIENSRFTVNVVIEERALREVYLPHFRRCVDAGAGAVMSAYNRVNGAHCGHNVHLLTRILKGDWGFDGFVYSDFVLGCRGWDAFAAGLDVEAPDTVHFGEQLVAAVERGDVDAARIDDGARRVLRSLFRTLASPDPETYGAEVVACPAHRQLAREAAEKSIVLLRNQEVLPWRAGSLRHLLVAGPLAAVENLGDHGSSRVHPPHVVTPLQGLREALPPGCEVVHDPGDDLERLRSRAARADAVLVVVGYTHRDEGEFIPGRGIDLAGAGATSIGGDRVDLGLPPQQEAMILAAAEAHPAAVVAVMAGSAVTMERWRDRVGALLLLWYPGMEGGTALARVLLGAVDPGGRLPFTLPRRAADLPFFDREAAEIVYDLWHGYTRLERDGVAPAFPFGFGLSYTTFALSEGAAALDADAEGVSVTARVANTGERDGDAVVQLYAGPAEPGPDHPIKRLCGFRRLPLAAGASRDLSFEVPLLDLAWYDADSEPARWRLEGSRWRLHVGLDSSGGRGLDLEVELPDRSWPSGAR